MNRAGLLVNVLMFKDQVYEKLTGKSKCPVDHTKQREMQTRGTDPHESKMDGKKVNFMPKFTEGKA